MLSQRFIVVNYNSGEWLQRAVESILEFTDAQLSVVDNASSDDSFTRIKSSVDDPRVDWIANDENRGFAAANNQVLGNLSEDVAILMNPDCVLNANTMPPILAALRGNPEIGAASCRILNDDGSNQATSRRRFPTPLNALARVLQLHRLPKAWGRPEWAENFDFGGSAHAQEPLSYVPAISGAFMVIRRSTLEKIGVLDESYFMHCEDLDWCKRCEQFGIPIAYIPLASVVHAKGVSSKSRPIGVLWNLHNGMLRFFDTHYKSEYAWPIRALTKLGIYASFVLRACLSLFSPLKNRLHSAWRSVRGV